MVFCPATLVSIPNGLGARDCHKTQILAEVLMAALDNGRKQLIANAQKTKRASPIEPFRVKRFGSRRDFGLCKPSLDHGA